MTRDQLRPLSAGHKPKGLDDDGDSIVSADSLGPTKPTLKPAWAPGDTDKVHKVNYDTFHRMLDEYREAKRREGALDLKAKQLAAQLARTEEAAKRALVQTDVTAKGGAAQKLLDAERALFKMRDDNAELRSKLSRATKRGNEFKVAHDENKKRLDAALKDQRMMARKVGDLERKNKSLNKRPEDEYWGEEAGRRFAVQQEELVLVHEENMRLKKQLAQGGMAGKGAKGGASGADVEAFTAQIEELSALVRFYEKKVSSLAERQATSGGTAGAGPGPEDWVLEDLTHDGSLYLVDPKTNKLFTVPSGSGTYPRPVGLRLPSGTIKLGSNTHFDKFICSLDNYCQENEQKLDEVFRTFDTSGDGTLDRGELGRMLLQLMPEMDNKEVEVIRCLVDLDGDGHLTLPELKSAIKEAFAARNAAKTGRSLEVNQELGDVRDMLQLQRGAFREQFMSADTDGDGCVSHMDLLKLIRRFVPGMTQRQVRYLLTKVLEWDVAGEGRASLSDLYQALELAPVYRAGKGLAAAGKASIGVGAPGAGAGAGAAGVDTPTKPGRTAAGVMASPGQMGAGAKVGAAVQQQREGFMRDRLAQLEAQLDSAHTREGALEADAKRVDIMRRDLAVARARIEDLEKDYMKLDVLNHMAEQGGPDDKLQAAWETASQFKKRYMEHKAELDTIRLAAARMQSQLEETHKLLHEEHRKRFRLEDDNTRLAMECARIKDLEALLNKERSERLNLEREYMDLQNKALSDPGRNLSEVRQLRGDVRALEHAKAVAEAKEGAVRRELSDVRAQLDSMSVDTYRSWQAENGELKKRVIQLEHEVKAAQEKLEVFRQTQQGPTQASGIVDNMLAAHQQQMLQHALEQQQQQQEQQAQAPPDFGALFGAPAGGMPGAVPMVPMADRRPDANKSEDEIRHELAQLRDVWDADQQELKKLHKVLATESGQTLEAKAALEETHREMDRLRSDLQHQLHSMKREMDRKDERMRKLELQLRGAYSGVNRALRTSHMRESRTTSTPDDLSELSPDQNILELHISDASLQEDALGKDPSTFFTFDFYVHDTQATPVMASSRPQFNTLVQYIVDNETFLLDYLDTHVLELELNRARGWDYDPVGVARIKLHEILEDLEVGGAMGSNRAYHHVDVLGANGQVVGRVRYGFAFRRPLDTVLREHKNQARMRVSEPDPRDPATTAVANAMSDPTTATYIKAIITRCEGLCLPGGGGSPLRPYVWYRFPGHRDAHTTRAEHGPNPYFCDEFLWLISRTPALETSLRTRELELAVFDDAGGEDAMHSIIGVARVPLQDLAENIPIEGTFLLAHPVTKQSAGAIVLGLGWANPITMGRATTARDAMLVGGGGGGGAHPLSGRPGGLAGVAGPGPRAFDSAVDTGLAGFEGDELREVPAHPRARPPTLNTSLGSGQPQPLLHQTAVPGAATVQQPALQQPGQGSVREQLLRQQPQYHPPTATTSTQPQPGPWGASYSTFGAPAPSAGGGGQQSPAELLQQRQELLQREQAALTAQLAQLQGGGVGMTGTEPPLPATSTLMHHPAPQLGGSALHNPAPPQSLPRGLQQQPLSSGGGYGLAAPSGVVSGADAAALAGGGSAIPPRVPANRFGSPAPGSGLGLATPAGAGSSALSGAFGGLPAGAPGGVGANSSALAPGSGLGLATPAGAGSSALSGAFGGLPAGAPPGAGGAYSSALAPGSGLGPATPAGAGGAYSSSLAPPPPPLHSLFGGGQAAGAGIGAAAAPPPPPSLFGGGQELRQGAGVGGGAYSSSLAPPPPTLFGGGQGGAGAGTGAPQPPPSLFGGGQGFGQGGLGGAGTGTGAAPPTPSLFGGGQGYPSGQGDLVGVPPTIDFGQGLSGAPQPPIGQLGSGSLYGLGGEPGGVSMLLPQAQAARQAGRPAAQNRYGGSGRLSPDSMSPLHQRLNQGMEPQSSATPRPTQGRY